MLLIAIGCALAACGGESADDWPEGRPHITKLRYVGQAPHEPGQQYPEFQFTIAFEDTNGDLGGGRIEVRLDGEKAGEKPLAEVFEGAAPKIPLDATSGEFDVDTQPEVDLAVGEKIRIGFVLYDAAGEESNDPSVVLQAFMPGGG
jgi:hypothetical protein